MLRNKSARVFAVIFMLAIASSVMALDILTLRQNMWKWSSLEAVINESLSFNFGHHYTPVVPIDEAYIEIEAARTEICKIVAGIDNSKDMEEAREVADEFQKMLGHEAEVGNALDKLLDMQEKYIKVHSNR
jgi:hypothetical protein